MDLNVDLVIGFFIKKFCSCRILWILIKAKKEDLRSETLYESGCNRFCNDERKIWNNYLDSIIDTKLTEYNRFRNEFLYRTNYFNPWNLKTICSAISVPPNCRSPQFPEPISPTQNRYNDRCSPLNSRINAQRSRESLRWAESAWWER